jgi:hypothetical protein
MAFTAHRVSTPNELQQIYRLRYDVYIDELSNRHPLADHAQRQLRDTLDDAAPVVIGAYDDGKLVGTVRFNAIADCPREMLTFHQIPNAYYDQAARRIVASMLIVGRRYRATTAVVHLCRAAARVSREKEVLSVHLFGESHNAKLYERMGFAVGWDRPLSHPIYREVFPAELNAQASASGTFYHRVSPRSADPRRAQSP